MIQRFIRSGQSAVQSIFLDRGTDVGYCFDQLNLRGALHPPASNTVGISPSNIFEILLNDFSGALKHAVTSFCSSLQAPRILRLAAD